MALIGLLVVAQPSLLFGDDCDDVPVYAEPPLCCPDTIETGSDVAELPNYVCTSTSINESHDDWDEVKAVDMKWHEHDVNCGCNVGSVTYSETKTHTNTNCFSMNGEFEYSATATIGGNLAGIVKAEASATATWTVGAGYGNEVSDQETLTASTGFQPVKCSEWWYNKWYYKGTVNGTADHKRHFSASNDDGPCWIGQYEEPATGQSIDEGAYTFYAHGVTEYSGSYAPWGQGFQNADCRCTECAPITQCYKYECEGDPCGSCD